MTTRTEQIVTALLAQREAVLVGSKDPKKLRVLRSLLYDLIKVRPPEDVVDAYKELRAYLTTPATFDHSDAMDSMVILLQFRPQMDVETELPKLQKLLEDCVQSNLPDNFKEFCYSRLEEIFGVYLETRPVEIKLQAAVSALEGGELDTEALSELLRKIAQNKSRL